MPNEWPEQYREREERARRPGVGGAAAAGGAVGWLTQGLWRRPGGRVTQALAGVGRAAGSVPIVGPMATKAAGALGLAGAATGIAVFGVALGLAAKAAAKLTDAQIRMTEEFLKARKVYQVGAAYGMGLAPTGLGGAQAALATTRAAVGFGVTREVEEMRVRRAERWQAAGAGQTGSAFFRGLGAGPKMFWEGVRGAGRGIRAGTGAIVNWLAEVKGEDVGAGAESMRRQAFQESYSARRKRTLLEQAFPMLQYEYARGTAMEGMYPGAGAVAIATPANPMHRELMAKIDEAIDSINRLGRLP